MPVLIEFDLITDSMLHPVRSAVELNSLCRLYFHCISYIKENVQISNHDQSVRNITNYFILEATHSYLAPFVARTAVTELFAVEFDVEPFPESRRYKVDMKR